MFSKHFKWLMIRSATANKSQRAITQTVVPFLNEKATNSFISFRIWFYLLCLWLFIYVLIVIKINGMAEAWSQVLIGDEDGAYVRWREADKRGFIKRPFCTIELYTAHNITIPTMAIRTSHHIPIQVEGECGREKIFERNFLSKDTRIVGKVKRDNCNKYL